MKKFYKLFLIIILFMLMTNVKAEKYAGHFRIAENVGDKAIYIDKKRADGYLQYKRFKFLRKVPENQFVYCLEPFIGISTESVYDYTMDDFTKIMNLTPEEWEKIELLAYYGYNYFGGGYEHSDSAWYAVTQVAIWRVVDTTTDFYFTDTLNGTKSLYQYEDYFTELDTLVSNHYVVPNINNTGVYNLNTTFSLTDQNSILDNYTITNSANIIVNKTSANTLEVRTISPGNAFITFTKTANNYTTPPIVFYDEEAQNAFEVGNYKPVSSTINFQVAGSKLTLYKVDSETNEVIKLPNFQFQILNSLNEPVCALDKCLWETNEDGYLTLPFYLPIGNYKIKEISTNKPYLLNQEEISFTVDENSGEEIKINFPNKRVMGELTLTKYGEEVVFEQNKAKYKKIKLDDIIFKIYAAQDIYQGSTLIYHKDDFIKEIKTQDGLATTTLELGDYYLIEDNNYPDYITPTPIYFSLNYVDDKTAIVYQKLDVENKLIKGKITIQKIDEETGEALANAYVEIYTKDNTLVYQGYTDNDGLITIDNIPYGEYYVKEIKAPDGYKVNLDIINFQIKENNEEIKITIKDKKEETPPEIIIDVPDTGLTIWHYEYVIFKDNKKNGMK